MTSLTVHPSTVLPIVLAPVTAAFMASEALFQQFVRKAEAALEAIDASAVYVTGPLLAGGWEPELVD